MDELTDFERTLMSALLAGEDPLLDELRGQAAVASVARRDCYESGVDVLLSIPDGAKPVDRDMTIGDLHVRLTETSAPAEAMVFVTQGRLESLEYYLVDGTPWPEDPVLVAASYFGGPECPRIDRELFKTRDLVFALKRRT